ncbi:MAG: YebC/PmpR family DNA-binding transcriptional regulator, partial [Pontimonas sp.]
AHHDHDRGFEQRGGGFEVITEPSDLVTARSAVQAAGIDYDSAEAEFVPNVKIEADVVTAKKVLALVEALEDSDDVQNVFTNLDLSADVVAALEESDE